jgi:hypothetical protein
MEKFGLSYIYIHVRFQKIIVRLLKILSLKLFSKNKKIILPYKSYENIFFFKKNSQNKLTNKSLYYNPCGDYKSYIDYVTINLGCKYFFLFVGFGLSSIKKKYSMYVNFFLTVRSYLILIFS